MREIAWEVCADPFEDARSIVEVESNQSVLMSSKVGKLDAGSTKHHLFFKSNRDGAVVPDPESNLDVLHHPFSIDLNGLLRSVSDNNVMRKNNSSDLMYSDLRFRREDG